MPEKDRIIQHPIIAIAIDVILLSIGVYILTRMRLTNVSLHLDQNHA